MNSPAFSLLERKKKLIDCATKAFAHFVGLPKDVRPDDKERTGIQVLVREPGTRNLVYFSVGQPSEAAMFFAVEKAVRAETLMHPTSQQSEKADVMKFRGSVRFTADGKTYQASVSGLMADEDVAVAVKILSFLFGKSSRNVCGGIINDGGFLPDRFVVSGNYLYDFVMKEI
jgi:hypothetical protein